MISVKDYLDAYMDSVRLVPQDPHSREIVRCYNRDLLERYPWLTPRYVGEIEFEENYNYEDTWLDDLPDGWRLAFGDQMIEELNCLINKYDVKDYSIEQIKEKFGELRWYDSGFPEEGRDEYFAWEDKYTDLSYRTCICCGKPAKYRTKGWIVPVCKKCLSRVNCTEENATPIVN